MKYKIIKVFIVLILLGFACKSYFSRKWLGYERIPLIGIFDERDYAFAGYTLRKTGIPTGWSIMGSYKGLADANNGKKLGFNGINITSNGNLPSLKNIKDFDYPSYTVTDVDVGKGKETILLVQPFLDHPPLGSLIYSMGIRNIPSRLDEIKVEDYRRIALYLSIVSGILIFIASYLISKNLGIAAISFIVYSTVPNFIFMSRFALLENVLIPLSLLELIIMTIIVGSNKPRRWLWMMSGMVAGLAILTKEQGLYIALLSFLYLIKTKSNFKNYVAFFIPLIILVGGYYAYAYYLSAETLISVFWEQFSRGSFGPLTMIRSFVQPKFENFPLDGYWLWGLISILTLKIGKNKEVGLLINFFLCYALVFLFFGGGSYEWYLLPFLPFLCIGIGFRLWNFVKEPRLRDIFLFVVLPLSTSFYWGYWVRHPDLGSSVYKGMLVVILLVYFISRLKIKWLWWVTIFMMLWQVNKWNESAFLYTTANWNNLPENYRVK